MLLFIYIADLLGLVYTVGSDILLYVVFIILIYCVTAHIYVHIADLLGSVISIQYIGSDISIMCCFYYPNILCYCSYMYIANRFLVVCDNYGWGVFFIYICTVNCLVL